MYLDGPPPKRDRSHEYHARVRRQQQQQQPHGQRPDTAGNPNVSPSPTFKDDIQSDPHSMERANRYRHTRAYFKSYLAGFHQNPKVKEAERREEAAKDMAYDGATRSVRRRGDRLWDKALEMQEHEKRRGPDKLAAEDYQGYADQLWRRAGLNYPDGPQPSQAVDYDEDMASWADAWVYPDDKNKVHLNPSVVREYMGPPEFRSLPRAVLLHEWAHTRQPKGMSQADSEGGAEAVMKILTDRLGLPYPRPTDKYAHWRDRALKRGPSYVMRDQFHGRD